MKKYISNMIDGAKSMKIKGIGLDKIILILVAGIVLVICSAGEDSKDSDNEDTSINNISENNTDYEKEVEDKLEDILEKIEGVGKVKVMVTLKSTAEKNILTEQPYSKSETDETDSDGGTRKQSQTEVTYNTVYITDGQGNTIPYVINENAPKIEGVAVIAKGGENAVVKDKINQVIKALFNVEANKISISKMK